MVKGGGGEGVPEIKDFSGLYFALVKGYVPWTIHPKPTCANPKNTKQPFLKAHPFRRLYKKAPSFEKLTNSMRVLCCKTNSGNQP